MRHSSGRGAIERRGGRGQVEPLAALAAVFAVCAGLVLYAGAVEDALPGESDRDTVEITTDRAVEATSEAGIVRPARLDRATKANPEGWKLNVTLTSEGKRWQYGPRPPATGTEATRRVSVYHEPGTVRPGQFRVVTWS